MWLVFGLGLCVGWVFLLFVVVSVGFSVKFLLNLKIYAVEMASRVRR